MTGAPDVLKRLGEIVTGAAREELLALERGTRSEVLDQAQAALAAATAQLAELEISRGRLDLTAPRDGIVDALPYKLGERPPAGAPVAVMLGKRNSFVSKGSRAIRPSAVSAWTDQTTRRVWPAMRSSLARTWPG